MTLRTKICNAGVSTFREFMCLGIGEGGNIIIYDGIFIEEEPLVALTEYDDSIVIRTEQTTSICIEENNDIIIEIIEQKKDEVDVI